MKVLQMSIIVLARLKVCHQSLISFDPSVVRQISLLEFHLPVSFMLWISCL